MPPICMVSPEQIVESGPASDGTDALTNRVIESALLHDEASVKVTIYSEVSVGAAIGSLIDALLKPVAGDHAKVPEPVATI